MSSSQHPARDAVARSHAPAAAPGIEVLDELLRRALRGFLAEPGTREALNQIARGFAVGARSHHLRAEEMLLRFKATWCSVPELQRDDLARREHLREQLVSLCIAEYYRDANAD